MDDRHAQPAARRQHAAELEHGRLQIVDVLQRHERDRDVSHLITKGKPSSIRDHRGCRLLAGRACRAIASDASIAITEWPRRRRSLLKRPSPAPTSIVNRPGGGTSFTNRLPWNRQYES